MLAFLATHPPIHTLAVAATGNGLRAADGGGPTRLRSRWARVEWRGGPLVVQHGGADRLICPDVSAKRRARAAYPVRRRPRFSQSLAAGIRQLRHSPIPLDSGVPRVSTFWRP
jgi:hypothetical protein